MEEKNIKKKAIIIGSIIVVIVLSKINMIIYITKLAKFIAKGYKIIIKT